MKNPYWLVRVPGNTHGCGAVELDEAATSDKAIEVWLDRDDNRQFFGGTEFEAILVTLTYDEDGQPVYGQITQ